MCSQVAPPGQARSVLHFTEYQSQVRYRILVWSWVFQFSNSVRSGSVMNAGGLDEGEDVLECEFVSKLLVCSCVLPFKYEIPFGDVIMSKYRLS